jgi:hypothetical protein
MAAVFTLPTTGGAGVTPKSRSGTGMFRRALEALMAARQRQADREIAEILARRGGVIGTSLPDAARKTRRRLGGLPG